MYRELLCNSPKVNIELPDFSYEDCFVNTKDKWWPEIGDMWKYAYVPRELLFIYLKQRILHYNMYKNIQFNTSVRHVIKEGAEFKVTSLHHPNAELETKAFDYCIVSSGHYTSCMMPAIQGFSSLRRA